MIINSADLQKQTDLIKKIESPINKYSWKESSEPELFFSADAKIMSYFPQTDRVLTLSKNTFLDWFMENGQLWTLQTNTTTAQYSIVKDTLGFSSIFKILEEDTANNNAEKLILLAAKNNVALLKKKDSSEMILISGDKTYNIAGEKFLISKHNNWWLIWTPWELWSYNQGEEPMLINRSGEQLQEVLPLDRYNTLALRWAEKTTVLFPYYYVSHDLLNFSTQSVAVESINRILYFTGEIDGKKDCGK